MTNGMGRRRFLVAASGGIVVILGSGAMVGLYSSDLPLRHWVSRIIRDHLPGVHIREGAIDAFTERMLAEGPFEQASTRLAGIANLFVPDVHDINGYTKERVADFERDVISRFLLGSNFFEVDNPLEDEIEYWGEAYCDNPFAQFDEA